MTMKFLSGALAAALTLGAGAALAEYPEKPVNFIWGCTDDVFTEAWGRTWAERMKASFDPIADAGHFLQNTHGAEVARLILERA